MPRPQWTARYMIYIHTLTNDKQTYCKALLETRIFLFLLLDISRSRAEGPVQPHLVVFPRTAMGNRQKNFQASYSHHTWTKYSRCKDAVYCYACRHFGLPNTESVFTSDGGYKNWEKSMFKDGGFASHAKSEAHINAMLAWKNFDRELKNKTFLMTKLSQEHTKRIQGNVTIL